MIKLTWHPFSELSTDQLYAVLAMRSAVFVVSQKCFYQDPDGKDQDALHLMGTEDGELVAYLRLFPPTTTQTDIVFGRVLTAESARSKGYGKRLLEELLSYCNTHFPRIAISCSAQHYLTKFYEGFGFQCYGEVYQDAGIPHIGMRRVGM